MFTHSSGNPELEKVLEQEMMENFRYRVPSVGTEFNEPESSSGKGKRMRVWEGEKCVKRFSRETCSVPASEPLCVEQSILGCLSLIPEPVARTHEARRAMQLEEERRNNGCGTKQVWMMFDGKSRPWNIKVGERGRELKERWEKENGMAVGEVRLMAGGRMLGWDGLANLADGTIVQVLGNICGGMGKKSRKKKEKNPWESDGSGVPSWAQEVPWSDGSSAEEQFEAIKKDELMEQFEKDLGSGAVDTLSKMETKQAQDMLTKLEENMAGISEEKRKMAVWSLMWMAEKKKEELREKEERGKAEEREKKLEEESERRESQSKNSETASENLMDDRSRKWEDRRRLEREGDEILKVLVKHEEKEAEERREKKEEERWAVWEEKRERRTEERWAKWDRQRLEKQGDEIVEMIRRHEEEEEEKRRQNEGMSAGDEHRMMLRMAENHVLEASKHREMVEEKAQKGINEAREKVVMEMGEMIEKGYGNVTFGSERIRPGEFFERKKGELERSEAEKGQAAEDRVLSRHLAEANRDEEERRIQGKGKSGNMAEERKGGEIARSMGEEMCPQVMMLQC